MKPMRTRRRQIAFIAVTAIAIAVAAAAWFHVSSRDGNGGRMGEYGPEKQREWAELLVTGLNTRDPNQVPVLRAYGRLSDEQRATIEGALPGRDCQYSLVTVEDRGEQGKQKIPGLRTENSTYQFDMTVSEKCADNVEMKRVLGVVAIAEMGYWDPFYFTE